MDNRHGLERTYLAWGEAVNGLLPAVAMTLSQSTLNKKGVEVAT